MGTPVRYPFGVSTEVATGTLGYYPLPDPFHTGSNISFGVAEYATDFDTFISGDYTITGTSSTIASVTPALGGTVVITPGAATTATAVYFTNLTRQLIAGQQLWFSSRAKMSAVAGNTVFAIGLRKGSATTDGIWFTKVAASTSIKLVGAVNSTATDLATGLGTMVADTYMDFGLYFNGTDLLAFINGALVARVAAPTIGATNAFTLTNAVLGHFWSFTPVSSETVTVDNAMTAEEIAR
jgi:hypothetical protein